MGQNSSDILESKSIYIHNWLPSEHQPNVFINKITLQHVQRHSLHISTNNTSQQMSKYTGRINNHQPYICRLLYFHPVPSQNNKTKQETTQRQYYFYTDKLFPIRQWNYDNIIMILHGFRKLVLLYGPIQITQKMISQSSAGEIKVWISDDAISNQPNRRYVYEEDTAKDLIKILLKKNYLIGKIFENSVSIRQIIQKLNKQRRDSNYKNPTTNSNNGLKHFQNQDILKPKERIFSTNSYKNPFIQTSDSLRYRQQNSSSTNTHGIKSFQKYPFTPFSIKKQGQLKPTSKGNNIIDNNKYEEHKFYKTQQQSNNYSIYKSKSSNQMHLQFKKNKQSNIEPRSNYSSIKNQTIQENNLLQNAVTPPSHLSKEKPSTHISTTPIKRFHFKPRVQSQFNFKNSFDKNKSNGGQGLKKEQVKINQQKTFKEGSPQKQIYRLPYNKHRVTEQQKNYVSQNITIINNNVNNYINNITHNHIVKFQKNTQPIQFNQYKTPNPTKIPQNNTNTPSNAPSKSPSKSPSNTMSNNSSQITKGYKEKPYIPGFIHHKKTDIGLSAQENQVNINNKPKSFCKSNQNDIKFQKLSITDTNFNKSYQKSQINDKSKCFQKSQSKKVHFIQNINHSNSYKEKINSRDGPTSPQIESKCQNVPFSSFHTNMTGNYDELFVPLRTKTTQFYQKNKFHQKKGEFGKSFTGNQTQQQSQPKPNIFQKLQTYQNPSLQDKSKEYKKQQLKDEIKNVLIGSGQTSIQSKKKLNSQLKNQFKSLLLDSIDLSPQQIKPSIKKVQYLPEAIKQVQQVIEVKDKIKKKQNIFAELKKQANTLLN